MLAPLRDYLYPKDPKSCTAKVCFFSRLLVYVDPDSPGSEEARWITSEDVNVEHLLDVFTSVDSNSGVVWDICAHFMRHLYWHKLRLVVLGPTIEGHPDDHRSKPRHLFQLSRLFELVGHHLEEKLFFAHALELWREQGVTSRSLKH